MNGVSRETSITARELRNIVQKLPTRQTLTDEYERERCGNQSKWKSQREHLDGWLSEYGEPGYYRRQHPGKDAQFFYNHFKCAAGLLWLAEALGEEPARLREAVIRVDAAGPNLARQCGALRSVIPWSRIAELLSALPTASGTRYGMARRENQSA